MSLLVAWARGAYCGLFGCWFKRMPLSPSELESGLYRKRACRSCGDVWVKTALTIRRDGSQNGGWIRNGKILGGTWIKEQNLERY